jgi:uncharacterized membrane protein
VWGASALSVTSGLLLFAADPQVIAADPFFRVKLVLLLLAGANAFAFHRVRRRGASTWSRRSRSRSGSPC